MPLKGVLKKREEKKPQDMKVPELREHLLAFGITGADLRKKRAELVEMLEDLIEESKNSSVFLSL